MSPTSNAFNALYNAVVNEVRDAISASNLMTPDLESILNNIQKTGVKSSTATKKPKQRRFTGYLLFVSEHAKVGMNGTGGRLQLAWSQQMLLRRWMLLS